MIKNKTSESTTSSRSKTSKRNNAKGKEFEREVAIAFRSIFPKASRRLEFQKHQVNGADLDYTDPYRIQCKNYVSYAPIGKIEEVVLDEEGIIPVLVTKGKRKKPVAVVYLDDFIELLKKVHGENEEEISVDDFI